jgi:hypothetical protein
MTGAQGWFFYVCVDDQGCLKEPEQFTAKPNSSDELKQSLTKVRDLAKKAEAEARRFSKAERDL